MSNSTLHLPTYLADGLHIPKSEARRLIATGKVTYDGNTVTDLDLHIDEPGKTLAVNTAKGSPRSHLTHRSNIQ